MTQKIIDWSLVIAWMSLIFFFSSQPTIKATSFHLLDFIIKKNAHIVEFFILFLLLRRALPPNHFRTAFFLALLYAFSDETHQLFTPGRTALFRDIVFDSLGISAALLLSQRKNSFLGISLI
jgi:VanZ family protein